MESSARSASGRQASAHARNGSARPSSSSDRTRQPWRWSRRQWTASTWTSEGARIVRRTPDAGMAVPGEIGRATGLCVMCDFKFVDEVVAHYHEPNMPGGWAYIELRHLE